jgi:hypothetical protein
VDLGVHNVLAPIVGSSSRIKCTCEFFRGRCAERASADERGGASTLNTLRFSSLKP